MALLSRREGEVVDALLPLHPLDIQEATVASLSLRRSPACAYNRQRAAVAGVRGVRCVTNSASGPT